MNSSQHFRHADKDLANPRTLALSMKSLRRVALLGSAELDNQARSVLNEIVALYAVPHLAMEFSSPLQI
eukprot:scaffold113104_cov18-Tisochrysis_lutea.AAC.2